MSGRVNCLGMILCGTIAAAGCGGGGGGSRGGSSYGCLLPAEAFECLGWSSSVTLTSQQEATVCGTSALVAACPTANLVGTCKNTVVAGGINEVLATNYYGGTSSPYPAVLASLAQNCTTGGGTWSVP